MALGGRCAGVVACYSWSLSVPKWLGDSVSVKHARRLCGASEKVLCEAIELIPAEGRQRASLKALVWF